MSSGRRVISILGELNEGKQRAGSKLSYGSVSRFASDWIGAKRLKLFVDIHRSDHQPSIWTISPTPPTITAPPRYQAPQTSDLSAQTVIAPRHQKPLHAAGCVLTAFHPTTLCHPDSDLHKASESSTRRRTPTTESLRVDTQV